MIRLLLDKAIEAFSMAIELYNKPTLKYRAEGFAMFICNAWELMLKAYILNKMKDKSIYYKDSTRTINLENCIKLVFTNSKAPLRLNLEKIIELRNTSTHFITEEYEMVYVPLFQACVFNFNEKMLEFHNIDLTMIIPQNFLTLAVSVKVLSEESIRAKYPEEIAHRLASTARRVSEMEQENSHQEFAISIVYNHYITKDKSKATSFVAFDNSADAKVTVLREVRNPNNTHNYNVNRLIKAVCSKLDKAGVVLKCKGEVKTFNRSHFNLFCKYYNLKEREQFCFVHTVNINPTYSYSYQAVDFIFGEIKKDPDYIIETLKNRIAYAKNKLTSGAKEF